jgi:hypothetical protein
VREWGIAENANPKTPERIEKYADDQREQMSLL